MSQAQTVVLEDNAEEVEIKIADKSAMRARYLAYGFIALVLLLTAALRFHLRNIPLERDEGEYAYAGQLMLQGIPPYQLAYNMKLPGTYAAYALIMAVFGQTTAGIHLGVMLVVLATIILVAILAWRFAGPVGAVAAAAAYGLLSASPYVLGFCGHATHFVVLPTVAALLLLLKAIEQRRSSMFFWSGILLGVAVLMKQPAAVFVIFAAFYFLRIQRQPIDWKFLGKGLAFYFGGTALPFLLTCLLMWRAGVFSTFWFWTVDYASQYASNYGLISGAYFFSANVSPIVSSSLWILIIAGLGVIAVCCDRKSSEGSKFILGFLVFSFLAVCPDLAFRPHYFIVMIPVVSLLAGIAVSTGTRLLALTRKRALLYIPAVIFTLALAACFYKQRSFFLETDPMVASHKVYDQDPFPEAVLISDYLRAHVPANARIAVLGSEPEIYFYTHMHSATGYIYTYGLMEDQKYALQMQYQMIHEIEAARPEVLVFVNLYSSWDTGPNSSQLIYQWARQYIAEHYNVCGVVDVPMNRWNYRWGAAAKTFTPKAYSAVLVFTRKES